MTDRPLADAVPGQLAIEVDPNGSPLTLDAAHWLVCFVPGLRKQWWHRFSNPKHKHVFAMRMIDEHTWMLFEPWWSRMMVNVLSLEEAVKFLRWAATGDVLEVREAIPGRGSQLRGWSNCAVLVSFLLGRRYWSWTPHGLYESLLAEEGVTRVDVRRLLADHCRIVANQCVRAALTPVLEAGFVPIEKVLQRLGSNIVAAVTSRAAISLHRLAVSDAFVFRDAADTCWTLGPEQTIEHLRSLMEQAQRRGEIRVGDCTLAARQFLSMLRGDVHLQILFVYGSAKAPTRAAIDLHVKSVVTVFLRGAGAV